MRQLVRIAAAVAGSPLSVTRRILADAAGSVPSEAVDEVLLQSYLFAGFPRTINAFAAWRDVSGAPAPADDPSARTKSLAQWSASGAEACRTVYGRKYDALRAHVGRLHPALDDWMVTDGYGKVLSRPGLPLAQRELCIVAACAAAEQPPQLRSHLRGALHCGATHEDLAQTIAALSDLLSRDAIAAAREELAKVRES